jgi:hypothetical protein
MFDHKRRNSELQTLQRDIKNYGKLSWAQKTFSILYSDSLVVTPENMPKFYSYIEKLCHDNDIYIHDLARIRAIKTALKKHNNILITK